MTKAKVYLKPNVLAEPLFNQWYAWSYLISPATAAMYVANLPLKIMQSFVAAPQAHVAALWSPAMLGGPFGNYGPERAGDIKALTGRTHRESAGLIELAGAISRLDQTLSEEADGTSLEPLYPKVPDGLKGYVELVYDLNHHPSIRFIEGLLYNSPYFDESAQSVALPLAESDDRSFVFSTPRLRSDDQLSLRVPFRSQALDRLFGMKTGPAPPEEVREMLNVPGEFEIEGGRITDLPFFGEHGDLNIRSRLAYHVSLGGRSVVCAADSNNLEPLLYERVRSLVEKVDVLLIGMECDGAPLSWLYGPLHTKPLSRKVDQSRRSDGSDHGKAIDIVNRLNPGEVYVYATGQEPWLTYLRTVHYTEASRPIVDSDRLVADCRGRGLKAERL